MPDLITNPQDIQLTEQNQLQAIMGNPPGWILYWGITVFLAGFLVMATIAYFVSYPDTIATEVTLTTSNPPIRVVSKASGKMEVLLVQNNDYIYADSTLAILESTANWEDIQALEVYLDEVNQLEEPEDFLKIRRPKEWTLGSLQTLYSSFSQNFNDYRLYLKQSAVFRKIDAMRAQIRQTERLIESLQTQQKTLNDEVDLAESDYKRHKKLFEDERSSAEVQVERTKSNWLSKRRQLENHQNSIITQNIRIEEIKVQINDLKQTRSDGHSSRQIVIREDIQRLKSAIVDWKEKYLIKAPVSGTILMNKNWSAQQFVRMEEEILTIVQEGGSDKIIGQAKLPLVGSGKVKDSMRVNIRLANFPHREFGILHGRVASISPVPDEETYLVEIALPDSLITTYDKPIKFTPEMKGEGLIITEDKRFIERIFEQFLDVWQNR